MQKDEVIQIFADWVQQNRNPKTALLPQNMGQNMIDILVADTEGMIEEAATQTPNAQRYITAVTLMLLAQIENTNKLQISETRLSQAIARMTRAVHLESLRRRGVIKDLRPDFHLDHIFDNQVQYQFELTELGKRMRQEADRSLSHLH
ncbi:MAG: hypothetical protein ACOH5I_14080 [Oligoflexus sp.]